MTDSELARLAVKARDRAYAPYSGFKVGAALLCGDGTVYLGVNVENAAYTPTNCAERTAFFKAVSEGARDFAAIAVAGWADNKRGFAYPCGVCRQVMAEFCGGDFKIIVTDGETLKTTTLAEILPNRFGPEDLSP